MSCYAHGGSVCHSDDTMDDDTEDKDDMKRKSRNLSEKKRRDQFNMLVNDLGSMVGTNTGKMDKSTVLKSIISFLKNHNEIAVRSKAHEIQEDWKPSFLTNEEFVRLILEALDGFIVVISSTGLIHYVSESVTSLLGHLPSDLTNTTIYDIVHQEDQSMLYNAFLNYAETNDQYNSSKENQVSFTCQIQRGCLNFREKAVYELVQFVGNFRSDVDARIDNLMPNNPSGDISDMDTKVVFVGTGRLLTPQLIREMTVIDNTKSEFTSRYSLEWKFLFLDHRAPPIIGYLPFEVLGTSGYDYYHVEDLDKVVVCHEALMQKGEGTSCCYRFLTKGQQWIWLQTRFYITYNQWNSKPEFIVCTHRVVSYADVVKEFTKKTDEFAKCEDMDAAESPSERQRVTTPSHVRSASSSWPGKCPNTSRHARLMGRLRPHSGPNSDTTSASDGSQGSARSRHTSHGARSKVRSSMKNADTPVVATSLQQTVTNQACIVFPEPTQFVATTSVPSIMATSFTAAPTGLVVSSLQTPENLFSPNIAMTPAQTQMKDELQRKYEELQQVIVHKQEEFRKVSEQLLFAKYGFLPPLLSVGVPSVTSPCPQTTRCVSSMTSSSLPPIETSMDEGVKIMSVPVPITLSVPVMSPDLFAHPMSVSTLSPASVLSHPNVT